MFDLVVRNATLPDGRTGIDIAVSGGRIATVGRKLGGTAGREIDAGGLLVTPPFVDVHFHLDATLTLGLAGARNQSGTLAEGIVLWRKTQPHLNAEGLRRRALA